MSGGGLHAKGPDQKPIAGFSVRFSSKKIGSGGKKGTSQVPASRSHTLKAGYPTAAHIVQAQFPTGGRSQIDQDPRDRPAPDAANCRPQSRFPWGWIRAAG